MKEKKLNLYSVYFFWVKGEWVYYLWEGWVYQTGLELHPSSVFFLEHTSPSHLDC